MPIGTFGRCSAGQWSQASSLRTATWMLCSRPDAFNRLVRMQCVGLSVQKFWSEARGASSRCERRRRLMNGKSPSRRSKSGYDKQIALVLQGGGALGSYQAGVYEALAEHGYLPEWVAGISIGAINSAIIAGNAPRDRVAKLRIFWEQVSSPTRNWLDLPFDVWQGSMRQLSALSALMFGQPGFFRPQPFSIVQQSSYYDTSDLKRTLERL